MIIYLPQENWNDVFGFLPRSQLGRLVSLIGDWYFASKAQYYLHECGKIALGFLSINLSSNGPTIFKYYNFQQRLPLADVPMPENVKHFEGIYIRFRALRGRMANHPKMRQLANFNFTIFSIYYDESALRFLHEFERKSLFVNANFSFTHLTDFNGSKPFRFLSTIMSKIQPLFNGSINQIDVIENSEILDIFQEKEHTEWVNQMFTSTRFLKARYNGRNDWFCGWLKTPRPDGKPRVLRLNPPDMNLFGSISSFIKYLKKDFLEAKQAISFVISIECRHISDRPYFQSTSLDNQQTKEKLAIKKQHVFALISRYPTDATEEWVEGMAKYEACRESRHIAFDFESNYYENFNQQGDFLHQTKWRRLGSKRRQKRRHTT